MAGLGGDGSPDSQELRCIMENHARFAESQDPLISSPLRRQDRVIDADNADDAGYATEVLRVAGGGGATESTGETSTDTDILKGNLGADADDRGLRASSTGVLNANDTITTANASSLTQTSATTALQRKRVVASRDEKGRLRLYEENGQHYKSKLPETMDDLNQSIGSNLSATQEIASQHYERFRVAYAVDSSGSETHEEERLRDIMRSHPDAEADTSKLSTLDFDQTIAVTNTPRTNTQHQNGNGVMQLIADSPTNFHLNHDNHFQPPETPASRNPFPNQGTVLPPGELFQATQPTPVVETQPSGITPHPPSPYGIESNPADDEQLSSPLQRHAQNDRPSSQPHTIAASFSEGQNEPKKMGDGRTQLFSSSMHEPRATYIPRKESQQRRALLQTMSALGDSQDIDDMFGDMQAPHRRAAAERLKGIRRLASISARGRRTIPNNESTSDNVEVPSTANGEHGKRRRSDAEEYLAQSHGLDARDTQEDDEIVADSQELEHHLRNGANKLTKSSQIVKESSLLVPADTHCREATPASQASTQDEPIGEEYDGLNGKTTTSLESGDDEPVPSSSIRTDNALVPATSKNSTTPRRLLRDTIIPESSPARSEIELRTFADIAGSSGVTAPSLNEAPSPLSDPSAPNNDAIVVRSSSPVRSGLRRKVTLDAIEVSTLRNSRPHKEEDCSSQMASSPVPVPPSLPKLTITYSKKNTSAKKMEKPLLVKRKTQPKKSKAVTRIEMPLADSLASGVPDDDEMAVSYRKGLRRRRTTNNIVLEDSDQSVVSPARPSRVNGVRSKAKASGTFIGMAFAVTFHKDQNLQKKTDLEKRISASGGIILAGGFEELFDEATTKLPTSSKASFRRYDASNNLALTTEAQGMGFACLVTNEHSRTSKYMQALALGLPCLSMRWVDDCLNAGEIIDWKYYLLVAGESTFLGGLHSRILTPYDATISKLVDVLESRNLPFHDKNVLMVAGTSKEKEGSASVFAFLIRVMGASKLGRAKDSDEARKMLIDAEGTPDEFNILFTDKNKSDMEKGVFEMGPFPNLGGKRKRSSGVVTDPVPEEISVVNNETIIQGLIDGRFNF